jgi:alpha-methylacyl-CoA racemase
MLAALTGLKILTVSLNLPGPVAAAACSEHGAEVITVLPPAGDPMAGYSPSFFEELHRGQERRTVNLREESGRAEAHGLVRWADVLITSSRPQALVRMGMDFATTSALNPLLCQVDIVGYPGERADEPGHDLTYQAEHGLVGEDLPRTLLSDMAGGQQAFAECLLALRLREATGSGVRREVALSQAAEFLATPLRHGLTGPGDLLGGGTPWYAVYPTADGRVALAALEPHFRDRLAGLLGVDSGADAEIVGAQLRTAFSREPTRRWQEWAREHGLPLTAC